MFLGKSSTGGLVGYMGDVGIPAFSCERDGSYKMSFCSGLFGSVWQVWYQVDSPDGRGRNETSYTFAVLQGKEWWLTGVHLLHDLGMACYMMCCWMAAPALPGGEKRILISVGLAVVTGGYNPCEFYDMGNMRC